MRGVALLGAAMLLQGAAADAPPRALPNHLRYMRALNVPGRAGQACAVLDAETFSHAAPALIDLRIFPADAVAATGSGETPHEVPYAITLSESASEDIAEARLLNLGAGEGRSISFDLEMPARPYSEISLDLDPALHDFLGTATVVASDVKPGGKGHSVSFGTFTIFDLTAQHLSRSTTLPLPESTFPYLHIALDLTNAPGASGAEQTAARFAPAVVEGAEVPPSREAQAIYSIVAETTAIARSGRESVAKFELPARVPVERVEFVPSPAFKGNFSRDVRITATPQDTAKGGMDAGNSPPGADEASSMDADSRPPLPEKVTGTILRVHTSESGRAIDVDEVTVPAVLGANLQRAAKVEVAIENGDDQPLPMAAVRLEMRQRRLCFDAAAAASGPLALFYGDAALSAPVYDYERLFAPAEKPLTVTLGPQLANPDFTPRPGPARSFIDRHPEMLWAALIAAIAALGFVAVRSGKSVGR